MMEAKFWREVIEKRSDLLAALRSGRLNASYVESHVDGIPPSFTPKPLHGLSIALFSLATGIRDEWVGSLWAALLGTAAIGCVGLWTAKHFGPLAGFLSAIFLAVSRSHVMYSRSQLAESDAMLILFCALALHISWCIGRSAARIGSKSIALGVVYGLAVAANYRCLLLLPLIGLWDGLATARYFRRWPTESVRRLSGILIGLAAVLCLFELPYRIYLWKGGSLPPGMLTYLQGLCAWYLRGQNMPVRESGGIFSLVHPHLNLIESYVYLDGGLWLLGLGLGLWASARIFKDEAWAVCALAFLPLVGFSLVTRGDGPRAVMTSIPFYAILCALGWGWIYARMEARTSRLPRIAVALAIGVVVIMGFCSSWNETRVESAWPEVGRWLKEQPEDVRLTTFPLAVRYYLRNDLAELPPKSADPLPRGVWIVDRYNAHYAYPYETVKRLREQYKPEKVFEGSVYPSTGLFFDWGIFMRGGLERMSQGSPSDHSRIDWRNEIGHPGMGDIEIYRVN